VLQDRARLTTTPDSTDGAAEGVRIEPASISGEGGAIFAARRKEPTVNVSIFGGLNRRPFPPGWTHETVFAILGKLSWTCRAARQGKMLFLGRWRSSAG
jgi:hypothetical protein